MTVDGEAPAHLLTWLVAIEGAHDDVRSEVADAARLNRD